jgi:2',3'-cyclic-nucleotide 2'-phosphodiesterase (5'-nucleotidase family)
VRYDPARPAGDRVLEVTRGGAALDLDATLTLATNDYMGNGGDGYDVFEDKVRLVDAYAGTLMATQVIEYIAAQGSVAPVVDGRLQSVS